MTYPCLPPLSFRQDTLAREIINRVNNTPYGHKGRNKAPESASSSRTRPANADNKEGENPNLQATQYVKIPHFVHANFVLIHVFYLALPVNGRNLLSQD